MPKVSILMTSHNHAKFLARAIDSALNSTFTDFELLICDDSTDSSAEVINGFCDARIRRIFSTPTSCYEKWNAMLRYAQGELIALLPCDDTWEPSKLAAQVALLDADPNIGACFTQVLHVDEDGKPYDGNDFVFKNVEVAINRDAAGWRERFKIGNCLFACTAVYRRSLHDVLGAFDLAYPMLADLDFYMKINEVSQIAVIEEPLARNRIPTNRVVDADVSITFRRELWQLKEKHYGKSMKIMFATPFYENKGYSPYIKSMFQSVYTLARHTKMEFDFQEISGGSYIDHNRNMMANSFLNSDCTHLMFIDSDHSWDVQGLFKVIAADKDIVGAAYPVKNNWEQYGVTIHTDDNGIPIGENGLIRADKVPTGFMKIHRRVFEKLIEAYPDDWYWHGDQRLYNFFGHLTIDHVRYGEDISFGIRWQRIGGQIWLEPRVTMGHFGAQGWFGNYDTFLRKQPGGDLAPTIN